MNETWKQSFMTYLKKYFYMLASHKEIETKEEKTNIEHAKAIWLKLDSPVGPKYELWGY